MSLYEVQKFIYCLKKDKDLQKQLKADAETAMANFSLSDEEQRALKSGDLAVLYKMGVHPLLLAPYSRAMGIPRPEYQKQLNPLRGLLQMRS